MNFHHDACITLAQTTKSYRKWAAVNAFKFTSYIHSLSLLSAKTKTFIFVEHRWGTVAAEQQQQQLKRLDSQADGADLDRYALSKTGRKITEGKAAWCDEGCPKKRAALLVERRNLIVFNLELLLSLSSWPNCWLVRCRFRWWLCEKRARLHACVVFTLNMLIYTADPINLPYSC